MARSGSRLSAQLLRCLRQVAAACQPISGIDTAHHVCVPKISSASHILFAAIGFFPDVGASHPLSRLRKKCPPIPSPCRISVRAIPEFALLPPMTPIRAFLLAIKFCHLQLWYVPGAHWSSCYGRGGDQSRDGHPFRT
jgi:hypothetical protein